MIHLLQSILLPPGVVIIPLLLALWWLPRHRWRATTAIVVAGLLLYLFSAPAVIQMMLRGLNRYPPLTESRLEQRSADVGAIVVLGQGRYPSAPEFGGRDTVSSGGLARVRYAAWLHRRTNLPILVTGGRPAGEKSSEAALMRDVLQDEFNVSVRWLEEDSHTTWENAV
ncbi:MAG: YdcF family protein, partial [Magnetococcales bacterium]|nr:YdcF family protein [Magnetococcales bacterium]